MGINDEGKRIHIETFQKVWLCEAVDDEVKSQAAIPTVVRKSVVATDEDLDCILITIERKTNNSTKRGEKIGVLGVTGLPSFLVGQLHELVVNAAGRVVQSVCGPYLHVHEDQGKSGVRKCNCTRLLQQRY